MGAVTSTAPFCKVKVKVKVMSEEEQGLAELASFEDIGALIAGVDVNPYATNKALTDVTKTGDWLPYLSILDGNSAAVKNSEQPIGTFAFTQNRKLINLGKEFNCLLLAWRPKAMIFLSPPTAFYDPASEDFKQIEATADQKNSNKGYGPELLLWLPDHEIFISYFLGNKTGRNEAPNMIALINQKSYRAKLNTHLIKAMVLDKDTGQKIERTWFGPQVNTTDVAIKMPPGDQLVAELKKFNNPPKATQELDNESEVR